MGGLTLPSSNGATVVIGVKINLELNSILENLSIYETKGNKSEMIRILISEALREREKQEEIVNETAKQNGEN